MIPEVRIWRQNIEPLHKPHITNHKSEISPLVHLAARSALRALLATRLPFIAVAALLPCMSLHAGGGPDPARYADESFAMQAWPEARVLVWAKPGTSGIATQAGDWTGHASTADYLAGKEGRPATTGPDRNTDIILPDAPDGSSYVVGYTVELRKRSDGLDAPQWSCR